MAKTAKNKSNPPTDIKVVNVKSRLSQLALKPGGVSREDAVESATAAVEGLRTDYPDWLEKDLGVLQKAIATAHANGGADNEQLDQIYRKAAQIRDLGSSFDFPLITAAADSLCELIYRLKENQAYDPKSIDCHVTALQYLKQPRAHSKDDKQSLPLVRGLKALVERHDKPSLPKEAQTDDPTENTD